MKILLINGALRRLRQLLLEHLDAQITDASSHVQAFMRHVSEPNAAWIVAALEYYNDSVACRRSPMRSKAEWARAQGVPLPTIKRWWKSLRAWRIGDRYVFSEGAHAFRRGTVIKKVKIGRKVRNMKVADPGICIRGSADPAFPLAAAQEILQSTASNARVTAANLGGAAHAVERDTEATTDEVAAARATVVEALQVPMDFGKRRKTGTAG